MSWERIDFYRVKTGKTLKEVSAVIGVGTGMLMMVKSGRRRLSGKAIYRLEQAERDAGIKTPLDKLLESAEKDGAFNESPVRYAARSPENLQMLKEAAPEIKAMALSFEQFARGKFESIESELKAIRKELESKKKTHKA